jgi:hypothetical protein
MRTVETTYWTCGTDLVGSFGYARSAACYEKELAASKSEVERLTKLISLTRDKTNQ